MSANPLRVADATELSAPVLLLAYAGWSNGGEAATHALGHLVEELPVRRVARIDTEEFLDFTVARPQVRIGDGQQREIVWPDQVFYAARLDGQPHDLVIGAGVEPHLRWHAYCRTMLELVEQLGIGEVVMLGAYLDEVIYSQPIEVNAFSADPDRARGLPRASVSYEGPTGITSVLADAFERAGVPALSLWARLPYYVSTTPNSRGALALLQAVERALGLRLDKGGLERHAATFDATVAELIRGDPQLSAYVRELKRRSFSA